MLKKAVAILILFAFLLSISCGTNVNETNPDYGSAKINRETMDPDEEFFYIKEQLAEAKMDHVIGFTMKKGELFLIGYSDGASLPQDGLEEWTRNIQVMVFSPDGQLIRETAFDLPNQNAFPLSADIDQKGNIGVLYVDLGDALGTSHIVGHYDADGNLLQSHYPDLSGFVNQASLVLLMDDQMEEGVVAEENSSLEDGFYIYALESEIGLRKSAVKKGFCSLDTKDMTIYNDTKFVSGT